MDRAVNIYVPSIQSPPDAVPNYLQDTNEKRMYNDKLHYTLDHGFVALDIPQCMESFDSNKLLVGETYGTVALYNAETYNSLARTQIHGLKSHFDEPCVVK